MEMARRRFIAQVVVATGEARSELVSGSSRTSNRAAFISEVSDKLRLVPNGKKKLATVPTLINYLQF